MRWQTHPPGICGHPPGPQLSYPPTELEGALLDPIPPLTQTTGAMCPMRVRADVLPNRIEMPRGPGGGGGAVQSQHRPLLRPLGAHAQLPGQTPAGDALQSVARRRNTAPWAPHTAPTGVGGGAPTPRVTFHRVAVPLQGPGQSPVLPFACCVGSLRFVGRCGRCSCWCRFRGGGGGGTSPPHRPPPPSGGEAAHYAKTWC